MTIGSAEAQYVGIPKTFQPSLAAEAKRVHLKNPPLTAAPDVKTTLYRIGDALGMLRQIGVIPVPKPSLLVRTLIHRGKRLSRR